MSDRLRLFLLSLVAFILFALPATAQTPPDREYVAKYYSNASYTTIIGGKIIDCCGNVTVWGYYSTYQIWEEFPCSECMPGCGSEWFCSSKAMTDAPWRKWFANKPGLQFHPTPANRAKCAAMKKQREL